MVTLVGSNCVNIYRIPLCVKSKHSHFHLKKVKKGTPPSYGGNSDHDSLGVAPLGPLREKQVAWSGCWGFESSIYTFELV